MTTGHAHLLVSSDRAALLPMFLMHFFDETPFNVLLLNSSTAPEYFIDNRRLSIGGFEAGRELIQIVEWLRTAQSGLSDRISSLHVVGLSNGGHAALYAAAYNGYREVGSSDKNPLDSVTALCPVVDLRISLKNSLRGGEVPDYPDSKLFSFQRADDLEISHWTSIFFQFAIRQYLYGAAKFIPNLAKSLNDFNKLPERKYVDGLYIKQALSQYKNLPTEWFLSPLKNEKISNVRDLWRVNNFVGKSSSVKVPTLVWGSQNDFIIKYSKNSGALKAESQNSNIAVLGTRYGKHCMYSTVFGWSLTSRILRSYILSNSPEFLVEERTMPLDFLPIADLREGEKYFLRSGKLVKMR